MTQSDDSGDGRGDRPGPDDAADRVIGVVVATPHVAFSDGFRLSLSSEMGVELVGVAATLAELDGECLRANPAVVVVDLDVDVAASSGLDVRGVFAAIQARAADTGLVVLANAPDFDLVREAWGAGARAYLLKSAAMNELVWAIRAVAAGSWYLSPEVVQAVPGLASVGGTSPLSPREAEVLQLLASGLSSRQIGERLGISPRTVETHRVHIMEKLQLDGVASLTRFALRSGLR